MPVLHLDPQRFNREYGALCHRYFPQQTLDTPYGASYCVIGPGESTEPHQHYDGEAWFFVKGRGELTVEGEGTVVVSAGEIAYLPSHSRHVLKNSNPDEELALFSVWWDDGSAATKALKDRNLVIVAAPTPNGKLHLGHLSGPYVASDVYARYAKQRRVDVKVASGSDDNQSYTATKGMAMGLSPEAVTVKFGDANEKTLGNINVAVDYFLRPCRTPHFPEFVTDFLQVLVDKGAVVPKQTESLWCESCSLYLYEAHVKGGCPHCGEPTSGNGCEACALPNACIDLVAPVCGHCQAPASRQTHEQLFFQVEPQREVLTQFFDEVAMPPHLRAIADQLLARPLEPIAVSHFSGWGIPAPGRPGQVIFEFLEMAAGFLFQAARVNPDGSGADVTQPVKDGGWRWAFHDKGADVVQFLGIDNTYYFMVLMPAMLKAFDPEIRLPAALMCNEFFQLEGKKFSTSRNHAIWGDDAIAHVTPDALRFALALNRPETEQTSFSLDGLAGVLKEDLIGLVETWLGDLDARLAARGGTAPALGKLTLAQESFRDRLRAHGLNLASSYDVRDFSLRRAARTLLAFASDARDFGKLHQYLAGERQDTALALELAAARLFATVAAPLLPDTGAQLLAALGHPDAYWSVDLQPLPAGTPVGSLKVTRFSDSVAGVKALANGQVAAV